MDEADALGRTDAVEEAEVLDAVDTVDGTDALDRTDAVEEAEVLDATDTAVAVESADGEVGCTVSCFSRTEVIGMGRTSF